MIVGVLVVFSVRFICGCQVHAYMQGGAAARLPDGGI